MTAEGFSFARKTMTGRSANERSVTCGQVAGTRDGRAALMKPATTRTYRMIAATMGVMGIAAFSLLPGCGATTGSSPDYSAGSGSTEDGGKPGAGGSAGDSEAARGGSSGAAASSGTGSGASGAAGSSAEGGSAPGVACSNPEDDLDECNPGPNQICEAGMCMDGIIWAEHPIGMQLGPLGRGSGVLCLPQPNGGREDFACMTGEWCLANELCRCGNHPGCQVGEQCLPACEGEDCADPNDYSCVREFACDEENLDACAAEPGQLCMSGAEECSAAETCAAAGAAAGQITCGEGADADCCPAGHWCFNQEQCRCGTGPACEASETCALNGIGFYECTP